MKTIPKQQYWIDANGCWRWRGALSHNGYGIAPSTPARRANRWFYEYFVGPIPKNKQVQHICDVRDCVNPSHLKIGEPKDNTDDMRKRGRQCEGERASWAKLTEKQVRDIRKDPATYRAIAAKYGVTRSAIGAIVRRENWKHV